MTKPMVKKATAKGMGGAISNERNAWVFRAVSRGLGHCATGVVEDKCGEAGPRWEVIASRLKGGAK